MITVRKANDRGKADHGWLKTSFTFSFAEYFDERHVQFRNLRVMNEDYIAGGKGFGMHPHRDMEIVTYVLEGALEHRDSMGNHGVIKPGVVQRMSAGTGVLHSEHNPTDETTHLYQIWIMPREKGIEPGYEEKVIATSELGKLIPVATPNGEGGSVTINADTKLFAARLNEGDTVEYSLPKDHAAWLQVTRGSLAVNGETLDTSDGAAIEHVSELEILATGDTEFLLFDLD